ncbi:MAG TPA: Eco57I restriction-modification methylase domain-containing protein [Candidatus Wunengus sp. YC60]|uniref:Eco57I restriction-modification methylase domain-containing protein n=1 Tax=Candidatus Wunengus sp. YC60 TaxID=3367697 RepID=UPI004027B9B4
MNKTDAKNKIQILVDRFRQLSIEDRKKYNEANTRKDFIDPLFEALGWDIRNTLGSNDVIAEEKTIAGRIDYSFRINGITQLLLEAKAFSEDLERVQWGAQAVEYGWNKGISWVILSDFEGLKVFNSEWKNKNNKACLDLKYEDYITKFERLWLLSRESFETNELDKFLSEFGISSKRIKVGDKLAEDLIKWRQILTKNLKLWNKDLDNNLLNESIQKILDRLIFIRVTEDRGIEDKVLWQTYQQWKHNHFRPYNFIQMLVPLFRKFDSTYNSNLFHEHACETLETEGDPFRKIIPDMYADKEEGVKYRFDAIDVDVLGNVYEQYLGFVQGRMSGSKKREQGIYYTPSYIVNYLTKNTLKLALDSCQSINDLTKIKVLDPACGSGSFPIKALELISAKYKEFGYSDDLVKLSILGQNIFGVDLDKQAVEIARLNLLISSLNRKLRLPSLLNNIKKGNSLISGNDKDLKEYFGKDIQSYDPFQWQEEFPEVFKENSGFDVVIGNPPYLSYYSKFSQKPSESEVSYFVNHFLLWPNKNKTPRINSIMLFIYKALELLKPGGKCGFVVDNDFLTIKAFREIRRYILENCQIDLIVESAPFPNINIDVSLLLITKLDANNLPDDKTVKWVSKLEENGSEKGIKFVSQATFHNNQDEMFAVSEHEDLLDKIESQSTKLSNIARVTTGMVTTLEDFWSDEKKNENWHPGLFGSNVSKFSVVWPNEEQITHARGRMRYVCFDTRLEMEVNQRLAKTGSKTVKVIGSESRFTTPKLLVRQGPGSKEIIAAIDPKGRYYAHQTLHIVNEINSKYSLWYLLAIMNSTLISYYAQEKKIIKFGPKKPPQIRVADLKRVPVCVSTKENQSIRRDLELVAKEQSDIMEHINNMPNTDEKNRHIGVYERNMKKLNDLIYRLYSLTSEEVVIIERK